MVVVEELLDIRDLALRVESDQVHVVDDEGFVCFLNQYPYSGDEGREQTEIQSRTEGCPSDPNGKHPFDKKNKCMFSQPAGP